MMTVSESSASFRAIDLRNISTMPYWGQLDDEAREAIEIVGQVLPFRTNQYVLTHLVDWSRVPDDPIFQLIFPQRSMLAPNDFDAVRTMFRQGTSPEEQRAEINRIRLTLNPHPAEGP